MNSATQDKGSPLEFSLVRDDLPFRLMRRVGLVPKDGLGILRRALFFSLFAWLPIAIWALLRHRALPGPDVEEPLLAHFGVHVRCLVAIPLLIFARRPRPPCQAIPPLTMQRNPMWHVEEFTSCAIRAEGR